jgi:hypothetical protein
MPQPLAALMPLLARLASPLHAGEGFGFDPGWADLTGGPALLAALREAVGAGDVRRLEEVRRLLAAPECAERARIYYTVRFALGRPEGVGEAAQIAASVHRNACLLVEAASAAAAGREPNDPQLGYWTRWWLGATASTPPPRRTPVAGFYRDSGFLADFYFELAPGPPGTAFLHPEAALAAFGPSLRRAVEQAAAAAPRALCWRLALRDPLPEEAPPLDGDSAGAAAAVGVRLLARGRAHDPACLLAARVNHDGTLGKVGHEREKLLAAREAGFLRAGVAATSDLTESGIEQLRPLFVRRLRTLREAEDFAAASRPIPLL